MGETWKRRGRTVAIGAPAYSAYSPQVEITTKGQPGTTLVESAVGGPMRTSNAAAAQGTNGAGRVEAQSSEMGRGEIVVYPVVDLVAVVGTT